MEKLGLLAIGLLAVLAAELVSCRKAEKVDSQRVENIAGGDAGNEGDENRDKTTFVITVDGITSSSAVVTVTPSDNRTGYFFDLRKADEFTGFGGSLEAFAQLCIEELAERSGYGIDDLLAYGKARHSYEGELDADTEYLVFAAVAGSGKTVSHTAAEYFSTVKAATSDITFAFSADGATVTVTPSGSDTYIWDVVASAATEECSDDEFIARKIESLKSADRLASSLVSGEDSRTYDGLVNGAEYTAFAFGYSGGVTTGLSKWEFVYGASDGDGDSSADNSGSNDDNDNGSSNSNSSDNGNISDDDSGSSGSSGDSGSSGNDTGDTGDDDEFFYYYTTLSGNVEMTGIDSVYVRYVAEGEFIRWFIRMENGADGYFMQSEFISEAGRTTPEGEYVIDRRNFGLKAGTARAGSVENMDLCGTWYGDSDLDTFASAVSGNLRIARSGGEYSIAIEFRDGENNIVTARYTGGINII